MPTQLDPEQISGLTSSITNLETADLDLDNRITFEDSVNDSVDDSLSKRITFEDSVNDSVDESLSKRITSVSSRSDEVDSVLQSQIDNFNGKIFSLEETINGLDPSSSGSSGITSIQEVYDGEFITETMNEAVSKLVLIPGGTFREGDIVDLVIRCKKMNQFSPSTVRAYIGTSESFSENFNLLVADMSTSDRFIQISRLLSIRINSDDTEIFNSVFSSTDDMGSTNKTSKLPIDWESDNFLIITLQNSSMAEMTAASLIRIFSI